MSNPSPAFDPIVQSAIEQHGGSPVAPGANAAPGPLSDSPATAAGRRTLSTAFVRAGADGHVTVELRSGQVLVLRDVVMRPSDYCGTHAVGASAHSKYCGGYAEIAAARPGGAPPASDPGQSAPDHAAAK